MAGDPIPLVAVIVNGKIPPTVGVPDSTPLEERVTPVGNVPVSLNVGGGEPVADTVKVPAVPSINVVADTVVMVGALFVAEGLTTNEKLCVTGDPTPLVAVMVIGKVPLCVGVPPKELNPKAIPVGRVPDIVNGDGAGVPVAVAVNVCPATPCVNVAVFVDVNTGGPSIVRVKVSPAAGEIPFMATTPS